MRPQLLAETIKAHHRIGRAMLIEGEPGVGKSTVPKQVAADLGIGFGIINVPLKLQEDYGMPVISADRSEIKFVVPEEVFPFEGSTYFGPEGIFVVDELSGGGNAEQKVWSGIIQDRQLHGRKIMPGWTFVATGNRTKDRAGANRILSMLANRMNRYTFEPHLDDWCNWAMANGVDPMVISFLRFKPGLLAAFDPNMDSNPTPRAWSEGVSPFIGNLPADAQFETFQGAVGEGAAAEFTAFLKVCLKMPNPDAILLAPDTAEVPTEPAIVYAVCGAVAQRASQANFERVMTYLKRLPPEFMVLGVRDSMAHDKGVIQTKAFINWSMKEGADILM